MKPHAPEFGDINNPISVPGGLGRSQGEHRQCSDRDFQRSCDSRTRFKENPGEIAAIILEPIMMNVGLCMPQPGFLEGLRDLCDKYGALLIFDEVKTGAKLCWGGAVGIFRCQAGHDLSGQVHRRRLAAGCVRHAQAVMDLISHHKVFHGGTYNTNPVSMAAGLATFREILTRENYTHVEKLSNKLVDGYRKTVAKVGLQAYVAVPVRMEH